MRRSLPLLQELKQWLNVATPAARNIVRRIISDSPEPLATHEIFERSQNEYPLERTEEEERTMTFARLLQRKGAPLPPSPVHHIRSIRYLKSVVLADMAKRDEIIKFHRTRQPTPHESAIAANLKPPTRSQRKKRGAVGPGKQPTRLRDGLIYEWLWRLKTPEDCENDAVQERKESERAKKLKEQKRLAKLQSGSSQRPSPRARELQWEQEQKSLFLSGKSQNNDTHNA